VLAISKNEFINFEQKILIDILSYEIKEVPMEEASKLKSQKWKEYYAKNREYLILSKTIYNMDHRDRITCESCGGFYILKNKNRHLITSKHIKAGKEQTIIPTEKIPKTITKKLTRQELRWQELYGNTCWET
jgi:hypothetical protein